MARQTTKAAQAKKRVGIKTITRKKVTIRVIGTTPLILNSMSAKTKRELLIGSRKKTASEKSEIKHNPTQEFVDSIGPLDRDGPTAITFPASGMKQAMSTAALATDGLTKTGVNRSIYVEGERLPIYGTPVLRMDVVRQAGMNRAPDVRTRAHLERWATEFVVHFVSPEFSVGDIVSLVSNAGMLCGIGDFRQEKGAGSYGLWDVITDADDPEWNALADITAQEQRDHIEDPFYANAETEALMEALLDEMERRAA